MRKSKEEKERLMIKKEYKAPVLEVVLIDMEQAISCITEKRHYCELNIITQNNKYRLL